MQTSAAAALRLVQLQLAHTEIELDPPSPSFPSGLPAATPSSSLRFHHFASLSPPSDRTPDASLFRLGHALFDEIPDALVPPDAAADTRRHVLALRRKDRLEAWLADAVKADVEDDLRRAAAGEGAAGTRQGAGARRVFAMLSGHQVERACEAAVEAGDLRLATLLAQAGGDDEFREDVFLQLAKWREYRVEAHVAVSYRKVYELLCGNVGLSEGVAQGDKVDGAPAVHVSEGLDWKRAFGLQLWYGTFQSSVATAVERYEAAAQADKHVAAPFPAYIEKPTSSASTSTWTTVWAPSKGEAPTDPLFELLKVFTSPTHPLERALLPRNFGSSPTDYRMTWHLYTLLSRVLRRRDFEDRVEVGEDGADVEGNSVRADQVAESYAAQLEGEGLWTWAAFVLLHLELPERSVLVLPGVSMGPIPLTSCLLTPSQARGRPARAPHPPRPDPDGRRDGLPDRHAQAPADVARGRAGRRGQGQGRGVCAVQAAPGGRRLCGRAPGSGGRARAGGGHPERLCAGAEAV